MGRCIICGTAVDGHICKTHEEDVVFEFEGRRPGQLTPGRYYEGTVDGYADFGVFVDIGASVTGLLHQSEIEPRLESLDWEPGDKVYVQVLRVRDNGDVDLGWSIRTRERDFRGKLIDDPSGGERLPDESDDNADEQRSTGGTSAVTKTKPTESTTPTDNAAKETPVANGAGGAAATAEQAVVPSRVEIEALEDEVGSRVTVEGEVTSVHQTGGPTIFEVRDESEIIDVAAFVEAGVRAYPEIETGDLVEVVGEVERRREDLQIESESVERLDEDEASEVQERLEAALDSEARPEPVDLLAGHEGIEARSEDLVDAATAIRRAVLESRPVILRHTATADGYVAGAAIERAVLPLVREEHTRSDAVYHYFDRRPLDSVVYDMDDATADVSSMLSDHERHDEPLPLVVLIDAGSTVESLEAYEFLSVYGVEHLVIDDEPADPEIRDAVSTVIDTGSADVTTTALAANVSIHIDETVRDDLAHLPAVSYWETPPAAYLDLAEDAGYDEQTTRELREAVALSAYYQTYEDKRQLIIDLLFGEATPEGDARGLASHVSEQFREKLDEAVRTAEANVEVREAGGVRFTVLDAELFADGFEFPPTTLLADELHRRDRGHADRQATITITSDELYVRSDLDIDLRAVAGRVDSTVENAGVRAVGGNEGYIEFIAGAKEVVLRETIAAVVKEQ